LKARRGEKNIAGRGAGGAITLAISKGGGKNSATTGSGVVGAERGKEAGGEGQASISTDRAWETRGVRVENSDFWGQAIREESGAIRWAVKVLFSGMVNPREGVKRYGSRKSGADISEETN